MKLVGLELKNFRQHVDASIAFQDGVTGIVGPNGSGKTTILEAIAWALYGAPAVRGTNETVRSTASEGGSKASAALTFELGGQVYRAARSLDSSGRSGHAVLEVDGRALRTGMTEVSEAVARLLGMDYRAFFTSFFTKQKELEFMAALDGRQRAVAIGRMLGYDRLTTARDQANQDKLGLAREIEGIEKGLGDPEELKQRKRDAESALAVASAALGEAESDRQAAQEAVDKLKPLREASDQKAKRHEELSRRLEIDRADAERTEKRVNVLATELRDLERKRGEFDEIRTKLAGYKDVAEEFKQLSELQKHEGERRQLSGEIAGLEGDLKRLEARARHLKDAQGAQTRASIALSEAESLLARADASIRALREEKVARERGLAAQIEQLNSQKAEVHEKRAQIAEAGADGKCPTCERPLADELDTVLGNFDRQIEDITGRVSSLDQELTRSTADTSAVESAQTSRDKVAKQVDDLRSEKTAADKRVAECEAVAGEIGPKSTRLGELRDQLAKLPSGFDQARFSELQQVKDALQPDRERAAALKSELDRVTGLQSEHAELSDHLKSKNDAISAAAKSLEELAFSPEEHERVTKEFDAANAALNAAAVELERRRGDVNTASAILGGIKQDEENYKSKLGELRSKRSERLHLQTLAEAFDRLRAELNDRIRPELESIASELLAVMTDGRYNVLRVNDDYRAVIVDDGEEKPVISGGEDDVVNLALRLAISQMIADRAGQSFSLLILDEVFGSLDESRRDNVVTLLQNLKNRFEQIVLITHVESIHDAVDNCLWVEFDERTKTSRLRDESLEAGARHIIEN